MKFYLPSYGDKRVKHNKFLLFPKIINCEKRWLEWASWCEYYDSDWYGWKPYVWLDNNKTTKGETNTLEL